MTHFFRRYARFLSPTLALFALGVGWLPGSPFWLRMTLWIGLTLFNTIWWLLQGPTYNSVADPDPLLVAEWRRLARGAFLGRMVSALLLVTIALIAMLGASALPDGRAATSFWGYHALLLVAIGIGVVEEGGRYWRAQRA